MANEKHLLMVIQGAWKDSSLAEERWETTLRLALVMGGTVDPISTFPSNWEPVPDPLSTSGTGFTGSSNWSVQGPAAETFDPLSWLEDYGMPSATDWMGQSYLSSQAYLTAVLLYPIGDTGHVIPAPPFATGTPARIDFTDSTRDGGAATTLLPLQNTIVCSHRTGQTGRGGRGRMFLPGLALTALQTSAVPLVSSTARTSIAAAQVDLINGLTAVGSLAEWATQPVITGGGSSNGWVNYATITEVRVGNVPDTQRRRRAALTETYTAASV